MDTSRFAPERIDVTPLMRANDNPHKRDILNELEAKRASYRKITKHLIGAIAAARCGMAKDDLEAKTIAKHLETYKSQCLMMEDELTRRIERGA